MSEIFMMNGEGQIANIFVSEMPKDLGPRTAISEK
jgi:hypothetical protein